MQAFIQIASFLAMQVQSFIIKFCGLEVHKVKRSKKKVLGFGIQIFTTDILVHVDI